MVKYCDLTICDSVNIEKYIHECYDGKGIKGSSPKTTFIMVGATYHQMGNSYNYGSALQAFALQTYLKKRRISVEDH